MPRHCRAENGSPLSRAFYYIAFTLTTFFGISLTAHAIEPGFNPAQVPNIPTVSPYEIRSLDYDSDGDGIVDYRVVGDFNNNGVLEWDDIQAALDNLCDPNGDGKQDAADGRLTDLNGDGVADEPFCGTLHILPGAWTSRLVLNSNLSDKKDDQIWLTNYQGLWLRGSGIDTTILRTIYSRIMFCRLHQETGCGGICSRQSKGYLTLSDFTFEGLEPRSWGKKDCDGDGLDSDNPLETDYRTRVLQTGITIWNTPPRVGYGVSVHDIKVTQADFNGFALGEIIGLTASNLSVYGAGATGIMFSGIQNGFGTNLHIENVDGQITAGAITITTEQILEPQNGGLMTRNLVLDGYTSLRNHMGVQVVAQGVGGITDVTLKNFHIIESLDATGLTATEFGIQIQDSGCIWDANGDGVANEPCYVTHVTFDGGEVRDCPRFGFTTNLHTNGPDRNYIIRNTSFEGNGYKIGTNDSHDVDLTWAPGILFENNTVTGKDYNQDGVPDVSHLIRVQSNRAELRNNIIRGVVATGTSALVHIRQADDVTITGNLLECTSSMVCNPIVAYADARRPLIEGNTLRMVAPIGVGINMTGEDSVVSGNIITGGQYGIISSGKGNYFVSNEIDTTNLSPSGYGIKFQGIDGRAADNTCKPASSTQYCIEIEPSAIGTTLQNNRNLTNPLKVYLDKRINPPPPPPPPAPLPVPAEPPVTEPAGGSPPASSEPGGSGGGGCTMVNTGNFDPTLLALLLSAFTLLACRRNRVKSFTV